MGAMILQLHMQITDMNIDKIHNVILTRLSATNADKHFLLLG